MTDPLPKQQQMFLQRLMASHVMTDEEAIELMNELGIEADDLDDTLTSINSMLTRGFGLEIATMVGDEGKRYHAVINQHADDIAKESFQQIVDPTRRMFIRLVLEALAAGPSVRSTLINLRTELQEPLKMDLDSADKCVEYLLDEHWVVRDLDDAKRRRDSMTAKIALGPRAFLELSHLLTDMGFPKDDLPQFVFHR